jgi:hypothetical protein
MALTFNLPSQIVVKTAAQWAVDTTVYSNKRILVTSDVYYGSTDQRKFKIADGTQTWSNLDYMPIAQTLAQVLANGSNTNSVSLKSNDNLTEFLVANNNIDAYVDNGSDVSEINMTPTTISISTTGASIDLSAASVTKNSVEIATINDIVQVNTSTIGTAINGATSATPNDTDLVMSVDTSVAKKNTWTQIKTFLKTYFDTIYQAAGTYLTSANITQTITNGVTDKAPSEDAVFDALALKSTQMQCSAAATSLVASQTYYFGINPTLTISTATVGRVFTFGNTGTVNKVVIQITLTGTVGSNHPCDVYLRNITAGTETLLGTITYDQGSNTTTAFTFTPSISIPNTTDFWSVKIATGAFTTAPTTIYHNARIFNTN